MITKDFRPNPVKGDIPRMDYPKGPYIPSSIMYIPSISNVPRSSSMIHTIVPEKNDPDGGEFDRRIILGENGPELQVILSNSNTSSTDLRTYTALIDTGASRSVVHEDLVSILNLKKCGSASMTTLASSHTTDLFIIRVCTEWGHCINIEAASLPLARGVDFIIGRDILQFWNFMYNGVEGYFVIND